uniref:Sm protein E n=1 Tax=Aegilops tauschii subsp. strangulata TaxID=200361 RepID=A0A453RYM9_AEGTS
MVSWVFQYCACHIFAAILSSVSQTFVAGFDEYMNLVLEDAEEINIKKNTRKSLGRILLKGDNITLMMNTGK